MEGKIEQSKGDWNGGIGGLLYYREHLRKDVLIKNPDNATFERSSEGSE